MADEDANNAVNEEVVSETTQTDSAPVENNSTDDSEDTSSDEQSGGEDTTEEEPSVQSDDGELHSPTEGEADDEESEDAEDSEEKPQTRAEKRKEQLKSEIDQLESKVDPQTEIRDLVARRNELRQQVEAKNAEVYQPATVDELLEQVNPETGDYYSRLEAKLEAMEQAKQVREYNDKVSDAQLTIQTEVQRTLQEFPMFDEKSPDYNAEVSEQAAQIMRNSLQIDENTGQIIGSSVSPYQLYKTIAAASQASAKTAQVKAQKSVQQMLSHADTPSGGQGREKTYQRMSLSEKEAYLRRKGHDV